MWKVWNSCGVFGARQRHAEEANLGLSEFANCLACNFWCCDIKVPKVLSHQPNWSLRTQVL